MTLNMNFFTWNIDNNKRQGFYKDLNAQLAKDDIDILILQEFFDDSFIVDLTGYAYKEVVDFVNESGKRWVRIFIKSNSKLAYTSQTSFASNKLKCLELETDNGFKFNLFGAHLYSQSRKTKSHQFFENSDIPKYILEYEDKQKNDSSIIVGDLNYKPFDIDLINPKFLNTSNDRMIIDLFKKRKLNGNSFRYFYNPMWNLLGDYNYKNKSPKTSGTYYWYPSDIERFHWNLIDGVILSPPIMNNLLLETLEIVTEINSKPLIKKSISKHEETLLVSGYSDHLPVRFSLKTN
jgi:exonuclease III